MLSAFSQFIFGGSGLFGARETGQNVCSWREKSLCFDLRSSDVDLNSTEQLIACFFPIEDIKGNPDELGILKVTNLRLIWLSCNKKRVNLSIGWRTVSLIFEQNLKDSLGSVVNSFCVLTKYDSTKYEFVFNKTPSYCDLWNSSDNYAALLELKKYKNVKYLAITHLTPAYLADSFDVVLKVWNSYKRTHLFRHCRANLTQLIPIDSNEESTHMSSKIGELNRLPNEDILDIYRKIVQSETRLIRYTGVLILTNIRMVWFDDTLPMRNLSIPYIRIEALKLKQGDRILVHTSDYLATSNQIEFRIIKDTDVINTKLLFEQMQNLYNIYKAKPRFGPESCNECIDVISYLRPIELYVGSLDDPLAQNLGPAFQSDVVPKPFSGSEKNEMIELIDESNIDKNELELLNYSAKLSNYLEEQPSKRDCELVYSEALGLVIERPSKDMDIRRIWHFDV